MELFYATTNERKAFSLQRELSRYGIVIVQKPIELIEIQAQTCEAVVQGKAKAAYEILKQPVVTLDAGFEIPSLNGFPGPYTKDILQQLHVEGILKLVEGKERQGIFKDCIAYLDERLSEPICFSSSQSGTIANERRGSLQKHTWSELGLIFIPDGSTKTIAEMTSDEYGEWRREFRQNSYAHKFVEWFLEHAKHL